jgi:glutamate-1-semialdehyde aminotransferase
MPTATLTFQLPDEQGDFDAAIAGRKALSALWDIDQACRSLLKHGEPTEAESALAERIREMIPSELLEI